ncbi:MAG: AMP-binding protein [Lachnospiraceae bacterium]|nr:AMP-binding protein [Lachnospiraceae bacterium]
MEFYKINPAYADNLMLLDDAGNRVTYGDFSAFYTETESHLRTRSLLFLFCENSIGSVFFYLLCLNKGLVPLLLDANMDQILARQLVETYTPDYIALPGRRAAPWGALACAEGFSYAVYENPAAKREDRAGGLHEDLALLLTTSGSTGSPKLVRQSQKNITANAASIADYLALSAAERPITSLPMQYTYGLSIINSHLLVGAAVLLTNRTLFEKEFWDFFNAAGATSFGGVPYTYEMLKRLSFFRMELPSLLTMTQAGGKLSPRLHQEFAEYAAKTGRRFIVMYGQTEATARMGYLPAADALRKCGSMGIAIPGGRFRLMEDEKTEVLVPETVGELVYEGPNVTMGYAQCREDLKKGDERGGVLFTGDMAKRDADGYYYITGRKKRFLKLFGKRVNMDEIEQLLKAEYEGLDVACTGEDDHMRIFVVCRDTAFCRQAEEWLSAKTGLHISGIRFLSIDEIPKNEAGKTLYKNLPADS